MVAAAEQGDLKTLVETLDSHPEYVNIICDKRRYIVVSLLYSIVVISIQ